MKRDLKYLKLLAKSFPTEQSACTEIINLEAILNLPKGTEHFITDLHGENEAFEHVLRNGSGVIRQKVEMIFGATLTETEIRELCTLIYYPEDKIRAVRSTLRTRARMQEWYRVMLMRIIQVMAVCSSKYTRSKVRKALPREYSYIVEELLHEWIEDNQNKRRYMMSIVDTIIATGRADHFIATICNVIHRLVIDSLHIIGDIYDRGPGAHLIMETLCNYHNYDIQWGNHDVVWMGAAAGSRACVANVLRMCFRYANLSTLEDGYGINLLPLTTFAMETYADDPCTLFRPKKNEYEQLPESQLALIAKMHKAIAIMQFKAEGKVIKMHPEYHLEKRLLLDKIDFEKGTVNVEGKEWPMKDMNLPPIHPKDPYAFTPEEEDVMNALEASIVNSEKLQAHIRFLYSHGALYSVCNGNLLFHGCMPIDEDGEFIDVEVNNVRLSGKKLMDYLDDQVRKAYFAPDKSEETGRSGDLMWFLWLGGDSPLFGKEKMTTFERLFIEDKATHKEPTRPYYKYINERWLAEKILKEFNLDPQTARILNGHVPVKIKNGESPIKGGGLIYVIDGGISKAYQKTTGIAGYTLIYNSRGMMLAEHKPYKPLNPDGTQEFTAPSMTIVYTLPERKSIIDTDSGKNLAEQVQDMLDLIQAFKEGLVKEHY